MSRSYKKNPIYNDSHVKTTKEMKKFANKKVRNTENVPNGMAYKKVFCSYDIRDFYRRQTWNEAKIEWENNYLGIRKWYSDFNEYYRWWLKYYKTK